MSERVGERERESGSWCGLESVCVRRERERQRREREECV